jgi:hypothetical protein
MDAIAVWRTKRGVAVALTTLIGAGLGVSALESAAASSSSDRLVQRLMRLDPGARLGGNTQVSAAPRARLVGVPRRHNAILGLGRGQLVLGGRGHDQLGAQADGTRILGGAGPDLIRAGAGDQVLSGGRGHDHIFGGPGDDRLEGGPGDDRLIDRDGATMVLPGAGTNRVDVADGDGDERVRCAPGSTNRIRADRDDRLHPSCRRGASTVRYMGTPSGNPPAHAAQQPVSGDGSNGNPYIAECDDGSGVFCSVSSFASRSLSGLWKNEYVPAYECPTSHPWLHNQNFAPGGTALPLGVEVRGLGPIAVSITGVSTTTDSFANGTATGFPNSSATSWSLGTNAYQVVLHCTNLSGANYKD